MNYVYILGAGASAGQHSSYGKDSWLMDSEYKIQTTSKLVSYNQVLPTIYKVSSRVEAMSYRLRGYSSSQLDANIGAKLSGIADELHKLSWLLYREPFPDILAETLYSLDYEQYLWFVRIFSLYLIIEQMFSGVDTRYKTFITNLIGGRGDVSFPSNVKLFSWNYDYQLEEAFFEKRRKEEIFRSFTEGIIIEPSELHRVATQFVSVKLNGFVTNFNMPERTHSNDFLLDCIKTSNPFNYELDEIQNGSRIRKVSGLIVNVFDKMSNHEFIPSMRFAWQHLTSKEIIHELKKLKKTVAATEVVVVGYSFPTLNAKVDKALFEIFQNPYKIYLQVAKADFEFISARVTSLLKAISNNQHEIVFVEPTQDFFIPYNLLRTL